MDGLTPATEAVPHQDDRAAAQLVNDGPHPIGVLGDRPWPGRLRGGTETGQVQGDRVQAVEDLVEVRESVWLTMPCSAGHEGPPVPYFTPHRRPPAKVLSAMSSG